MKSFDISVLKPKRCEESNDNEESSKETSTTSSFYENYEQLNYDEQGHDIMESFSVGEIMGFVATGLVMIVLATITVWCVRMGKCSRGNQQVCRSIFYVLHDFNLKTERM